MRANRFRQDLYFRLCADMITTPSLREQLDDSPDDLHNLILFISKRIKGISGDQAVALTGEVERWIHQHPQLGHDYAWPGNFRELEQCVRNVIIRKEYHPAFSAEQDAANDPQSSFAAAVREASLTRDELVSQYCTFVYAQTKNYEKAAARLGIDSRTFKSKIDQALLDKLRAAEQ